jgi:hypothetical protein
MSSDASLISGNVPEPYLLVKTGSCYEQFLVWLGLLWENFCCMHVTTVEHLANKEHCVIFCVIQLVSIIRFFSR